MNYRHHFHAGNFADVMKHVLLIQLLQQMTKKDKPLRYLDTHAGAGHYDLADAPAQRSGEYLQGIHRLVQLDEATVASAPKAAQRYLQQLSKLRSQFGRGYYAGSPWWALHELRREAEQGVTDKATLFETEPEVFTALSRSVRDKRVSVQQRDAYEGLIASVPPVEKRGLVLIDPPYEIERKDFPQLVTLLERAYTRWPTGTYVLWYPIKDRTLLERFEKAMVRTGIRRQLICELLVWPDDAPVGLNGSGMLIINPPYQFIDEAQAILTWLAPQLEMQANAGRAVVRWLVGE